MSVQLNAVVAQARRQPRRNAEVAGVDCVYAPASPYPSLNLTCHARRNGGSSRAVRVRTAILVEGKKTTLTPATLTECARALSMGAHCLLNVRIIHRCGMLSARHLSRLFDSCLHSPASTSPASRSVQINQIQRHPARTAHPAMISGMQACRSFLAQLALRLVPHSSLCPVRTHRLPSPPPHTPPHIRSTLPFTLARPPLSHPSAASPLVPSLRGLPS